MIILLVGEPKTGKTVSACTFPKPIVTLNLDDGLTSAINTKINGVPVVKDVDQIYSVDFFKTQAFDLDMKTDLKGTTAPDYAKEAPALVGKYNQVMRALMDTGAVPGNILHRIAGPSHMDPVTPQTLIIDSLTNMWQMWVEAVLAVNGRRHLQIADYGTLKGMLQGQFIPTLKALSKKIPFIILINHESMEKDELTGAVMEFPIGPSAAMGKSLSKDFDEIWRQRFEGGKYIWRTKAHGRFSSAGSRLNLPDSIPAHYDELVKLIGG